MPRYKLTVEYDGRPFAGWQIQADQLTVQGLLTSAVEALSGDKTLVQGAGRTDAGVHARAQVAHVDLTKEWDTDTVRDALNAHLRPHPIAILAAERTADDFNARSSAIRRHYLYRIVNRRADLTLDAGWAWRVPRTLDAAAMHAAAQRLVGKHDFTTFRSTECQAKSPVKTLDVLKVERGGEEVVAAVVAEEGVELDPEEVRRACREHLAGYKVPRRVVVVDELPRSPIGKVLHREVRDSLLSL